MSAPLVKGLIITASVLVAAGIAIYENEPLRRLIDEYRRKIAVAFYALGDNIHPEESSDESGNQAEMAELNRQRRNEIVQQNRAELVRQARAEGISVDLDELATLGLLDDGLEQERAAQRHTRSNSNDSFDGMVNQDGKLKTDAERQLDESSKAAVSSFEPVPDQGLRHRGAGVRGFDSGAAFANPFDDSEVMFDRDLIGPSVEETVPVTQQIRSISPRPASDVHILDQQSGLVTIPVFQSEFEHPQSQFKTEDELEAEIEEAIRRSLTESYAESNISETVQADSPPSADSLFDPASPRLNFMQTSSADQATYPPQLSRTVSFEEEPTGTLTPTEDAFSTVSSDFGDAMFGSAAEELPDADARSEAADTNDSFSVVGTATPASWTDVDSDSETEAVNGQSHSLRR